MIGKARNLADLLNSFATGDYENSCFHFIYAWSKIYQGYVRNIFGTEIDELTLSWIKHLQMTEIFTNQNSPKFFQVPVYGFHRVGCFQLLPLHNPLLLFSAFQNCLQGT